MMTKVIGLTGQTGAGKTTVSMAMRARGIAVIDADVLARDVVNNSKSCLGDLVLAFGCDMIDHNGELNRRRMASVVFSDKVKLRRLNALTHPHIVARIEDEIRVYRKRGAPLVVLDAPTLYDAGCEKMCAFVVAVLAPEEDRKMRILRRDSLTEEEAASRLRSQHSDTFFRDRANFIIENTQSADSLIEEFDIILRRMCPEQVEAYEKANV